MFESPAATSMIKLQAPLRPAKRQGNYVGQVGEFCQKMGYPTPAYTLCPRAAVSGPQWVCRAEVTIADELLMEEHSAPNKMEAKQKAAEHLKHKLQAALNADTKEAEVSATACNHKGLLQEVLAKVGDAQLPNYTIRREGQEHRPIFIARVTAGWRGQLITVEGDPEKTRRMAEHAAAKKFMSEHIFAEPKPRA